MHAELIPVRAGAWTWLVRKDSPPCARLLKDPESFLARPELRIKDSDVVTICRVPPAAPNERGLILRRLNYRRWRHRWRDVFRPSRALTALRRGLAMEAAGVPTPRSVAVAEVRRWRWPLQAYLVTEEIPNALNVGWVIRRHGNVPPELCRNLALALAQLHNAGFSHRDLKPANILVSGENTVAFIDLDAVRGYTRVPEVRAADDVARLARGLEKFPGITPLLRARFLRHYCRARALDRQHWGKLLQSRLGTRL